MLHIPSLRQWLCGLFILLLGALAADLTEEKEPQGPLKVRVDYNLVKSWPEIMKGRLDKVGVPSAIFSSYIRFKEPVSSISDEQLWRLTVDAHREMAANAKQYGIGKASLPGIMTALAVDNEIYFSSSIKGAGFTYKISPTPAKKALDQCAAVWWLQTMRIEAEHGNRGSCGEIMASHQFYLLHPNDRLDTKNPPARTTAVRTVNTDLNNPPAYLPCGTEKNELDTYGYRWGCREYLDLQNIHDIPLTAADNMPATIDVTKLAGGIEEIRQVTLCSLIDTEEE